MAREASLSMCVDCAYAMAKKLPEHDAKVLDYAVAQLLRQKVTDAQRPGMQLAVMVLETLAEAKEDGDW